MMRKVPAGWLLRYTLAALLAFGVLTLPASETTVFGTTHALADDDDDDGGGGGFGGDRGSRADRGRPARPRAAKVRKKPKVAPASRPIVVVLDLNDAALAEARRQGFTVLDDEGLEAVGVRVQRLRLPRNVGVARARAILTGLGASAVDANTIYRPQSEEDCVTPQCLGPAPTEPPQSGLGPCGNASTVGLVETAVDLKHPELAGHSIEVIELRPRKTRPSSNAHGTAVAMLFTGAAGAGAAGLLPDATMIVAVPYYRAKRSGDIALAFDVVRAIDALAQHNVDVINMSLTGPPNAVIERVLKRVHERGIPVVAAAGNAGARARPLYPAAYDTTIAVTAISASDKIYRRAIQGPHVDFAAPGVEVAFISSNGRMERRTGTSFAAPYVAAALAVLHRQNGKAGVDTLVSRLAPVARDLGGPGKDLVFGWGAIGLADICGR